MRKTWDKMTSRERYARYAEIAEQRLADKDEAFSQDRKGEGERARLQNERYWLEKERERYGVIRMSKPLSEQVA